MLRRSVGWMAVFAAACVRPAPAQDVPTVLPGDPAVAGSDLLGYDARWQSRVQRNGQWSDRSIVTETLVREGDHWLRVQVTDQGGWALESRVELDRATLRPVRLRRTLQAGTPEDVRARLEQAGFLQEFEIDFGADGVRTRAVPFDGDAEEREDRFSTSFFDGSTLGLLIAALPLEPGYSVRFPILFVDGRAADLTPYWVDATVIGWEEVAGRDALRVDVAWADFETGDVTSAPGPDAPGGAYWIHPGAGGDSPPVPRYRNDTFDILVTSGGA